MPVGSARRSILGRMPGLPRAILKPLRRGAQSIDARRDPKMVMRATRAISIRDPQALLATLPSRFAKDKDLSAERSGTHCTDIRSTWPAIIARSAEAVSGLLLKWE
jgi:hypothetical protein